MMDLGESSVQRIVITEDDDLDLDALLAGDDQPAKQSPLHLSSSDQAQFARPLPNNDALTSHMLDSMPIISASEEDGAEKQKQWILPAPAVPGDYLSSSLHRVPSKSILKKTSSYASFGMDTSGSASQSKLAKKSSFLSFSDFSTHSQSSRQTNPRPTSESSVVGIGLDLDESSLSQNKLQRSPTVDPADGAAGSVSVDDVSAHSGKLSISSSPKMRRNVSFHNVSVREYDRTIGDNPSCRSGPPLSLDWSYSKKQCKPLDEYEEERSGERADNARKFHMNKYKRRNMLSFNWGHTEEEMKAARKQTKKLQRQRSMTMYMLPFHMAHEGYISLKSMVSRKKSRDGLTDRSLSGSSTTRDGTCTGQHDVMPEPGTYHVDYEGLPSSVRTV